MKAQYRLKLDGVGCFALLVLTIAFHWFLASRFPDHGFLVGSLLWVGSCVTGIVIVARASSRAAVATLAAAQCPRCGERIGPRAAAMHARWKTESARIVRDGMRDQLRVDPSPLWQGECGACGQAIAFDPESGSVTREGPPPVG